jgi:hypothetical protein
MKTKLSNVGKILSRNEQKLIIGGDESIDDFGAANKCNKGCRTAADCDSTCPSCEKNTNWNDVLICVK